MIMIVNKIFSWNKLPLLCALLIALNTSCTDSFDNSNINHHGERLVKDKDLLTRIRVDLFPG